ncbi:MAG: DNA polymerase domain-containing protein [Candidatus Methanomethylicia archaeon]
MKIKFWLLDLNYEFRNGIPEVWLWGITSDERRILIVDRRFKPYFYAVLKGDVNAEDIGNSILRLFPRNVIGFEVCERKVFGKNVKALKIYCSDPDRVDDIASKVKGLPNILDVYEYDIRFTLRYLIDNGIRPCGWIEVDCEPLDGYGNVKVDSIYLALDKPISIEDPSIPKLKILGFWFICLSSSGSPKPEKDPIIVISTIDGDGVEKMFTVGEDLSDLNILKRFIDYVNSYDPDIIVSYGSNSRLIPYLLERARRNGLKLCIDRVGSEPHTSLYGHISITGRINLDLFDFADEFQEVKVKSLENIAEYLGVMKAEGVIEDFEVQDYWHDPNRRGDLYRYSMDNVKRIMGVYRAIIDFAIQLSYLVGLPLDFIGTAAVGFRVEWFLIRNAYRFGELVPKRKEVLYQPYAGAIVLQPKPGLHENVAVIDFRSMYPSIMLTYNVSPDTYIPPEEPEPQCGVYIAPEVKHRFKRDPPGFYRDVLKTLIEVRDNIRSVIKGLSLEDPLYKVLDARQKAIKVISNAMYGYAGWIGARWYIKPVAEAVTAWGRSLISNTLKISSEIGLKVVYGDTDSLFVEYKPELVEKLLGRIRSELGFEARVDKVYVRILFTEAKKRYCGLLEDGRLDFVGLEVVRGDWANVAKIAQERVLEIIMHGEGVNKALDFIRSFIGRMRKGEIPFKEYIIWKTLTKDLSEYEVKAPHVEAARILKEKGFSLSLGDKVGYIISIGTGKLYERAIPYMLASKDQLDVEYYISNQVLPAVSRILEVFGVREEQIMSLGKTKTLTDFFKPKVSGKP